jgi:hypothetical protein
VWEWDLWDHLVQDYDETKANYGSVKDNPQVRCFSPRCHPLRLCS